MLLTKTILVGKLKFGMN